MDSASKAHLRKALDEIDEAHRHLSQACAAVSSVCGLIGEWQKLRSLCDKMKKGSYRLEDLGPKKARGVDHRKGCKEIVSCKGSDEAEKEVA
jgi:hypothetical protein